MNKVFIEWVDSEASNNWESEKEVEYPKLFVQTFGYIIKENTDFISVSHSFDNDNKNYCGYITIPKCCIKHRKDIDDIIFKE